MKLNNSIMGLMACALVSASFCADAVTIDMGFQWIGDKGYTANVAFGYDDTVPDPYVYGYGLGPTHGIEYLRVSFYDYDPNRTPSRMMLNPPDPVVVVKDGESLYDNLLFTYDPVARKIIGDIYNDPGYFNIGMASAVGDLYVAGQIGGPSDLFPVIDNPDDTDPDHPLTADVPLDSIAGSTQFVPEPSSIALFAIGLAGLARRGRKSVL